MADTAHIRWLRMMRDSCPPDTPQRREWEVLLRAARRKGEGKDKEHGHYVPGFTAEEAIERLTSMFGVKR